jgi:hypothetical protein
MAKIGKILLFILILFIFIFGAKAQTLIVNQEELTSETVQFVGSGIVLKGTNYYEILIPSGVATIYYNLLLGKNLKISWQTILGKCYKIQFSPDLKNWISYDFEIEGTGAKYTFFDYLDEEKKFYRVIVK